MLLVQIGFQVQLVLQFFPVYEANSLPFFIFRQLLVSTLVILIGPQLFYAVNIFVLVKNVCPL